MYRHYFPKDILSRQHGLKRSVLAIELANAPEPFGSQCGVCSTHHLGHTHIPHVNRGISKPQNSFFLELALEELVVRMTALFLRNIFDHVDIMSNDIVTEIRHMTELLLHRCLVLLYQLFRYLYLKTWLCSWLCHKLPAGIQQRRIYHWEQKSRHRIRLWRVHLRSPVALREPFMSERLTGNYWEVST